MAVSQHTPRLEERGRKDGEYDGGSEVLVTLNDLKTQTVVRRYGGPTTAPTPPTTPRFYGARRTGSDSAHWRIIRIPVFPLTLGKTRKRGKSMDTAHIGKFDLQEPCGQPPGGQNIEGNYPSNLATSYKCGDFISPTFRSLSSSLAGNGSGTSRG